MTKREEGMLKIVEDYKHQISNDLLERSPKDPEFHRLRLFRNKLTELLNYMKIYCDKNCRDE